MNAVSAIAGIDHSESAGVRRIHVVIPHHHHFGGERKTIGNAPVNDCRGVGGNGHGSRMCKNQSPAA